MDPAERRDLRLPDDSSAGIEALSVLNRYSSCRFHFEPVALALRNSKADPTHSATKNAFTPNTPEVSGGFQIINAITGTNA